MQTQYRLFFVLALVGAVLACRWRIDDPPLVFSPAELPEAQAGQPYKITITVTGNITPVNIIYIENENLPEGLSLHYEERDNSAEILGTPLEPGEYEITITAFCLGTNVSGQKVEQKYTLVVN